MPALIQSRQIEGLSVYGVPQSEYTVDGVSGQDYAKAVATAALREAKAIEDESGAMAEVLRQRERKLDELGEALAIITKAIGTMKTKNQKSSDKSDEDDRLSDAAATLEKYGLSMKVEDKKVKREDAMKAQTDTQYAIDSEDNDLQQDMVTMQGLVSKRDNAFSTAAKLLRKVNATAGEIIQGLRG